MSFVEELKRRNVFRVGIAYVVVGWLLAQVAEFATENFGAPEWVLKIFVVFLLMGFVLALFFAWAFEMTPEGIKKEKDVDRSQSITTQTGRTLDYTIIVVLLLALGYFAYDKFVLDPARDAARSVAEQAAETEAQAQSAEKSIAVLPFVNMSDDAANEYFSDGISEEILNALGRVKELKVTGRSSSFAFKGKNQDLRLIGETLGVDHILEGSVRKAGETVRITAQLIQVEDGFHLWSETYDRELTDVFAIQDEIAGAILAQLKAQLIGGEVQAVAATRTNSEAYDLYLLAKQRMYERTGPTIEAAGEILDRAIAVDPTYAPAYAQRAIATLLLADTGGAYGDIPTEQARSASKLYVDKALELDPGLAEGWAALGFYYRQSRDAQDKIKAVEILEKALAINPGLINASNWLHNSFNELGKPVEAKEIVMGMVERDPLYRPGIRNAVNKYVEFGQQEAAWALLERIRPMVPNESIFRSSEAAIQLSVGHVAEGLELSEAALAMEASNSVTRFTQREGLELSGQYQRLAEMDEGFQPVFALVLLGRTEEAMIRAYKRLDEQADVATFFGILNRTGRSAELVAFLEERWPDLDTLHRDYPPYGAIGDFVMLDAALAYSRMGNQVRFEQAMSLIREYQEKMETAGVENSYFYMNSASYYAMAGELTTSLDFLDQAAALGFTGPLRLTLSWPWLEPLEGDPRYEAIQSRMTEHLNSERAKLGLAPSRI